MNNAFKKRIDELGRIVIPKQIRKDFKINNFDELDIYVQDGNIVIKKNIGIMQYKVKFDRILNFFLNKCNYMIIITDKNKVISTNYNLENDISSILYSMSYNQVFDYNGIYLLKNNIIIDSNYIGDIIFISKNIFDKDTLEVKEIKDIILDFIK